MMRLGLLLSFLLVATPAWSVVSEDAGADADSGNSDEIELTGPGQEMTVESDDVPKPPPPKPVATPVPAPAPKPVPRPVPKPAPKPAPKPKPVVPKSPWEWLVLEDFEKAAPGPGAGTLRRSGGDMKPQFACRVVAPGHDGTQGLVVEGVPALADGTVWSWTPADGKPRNLSGWRGIHLWAKASQAAGELRLGVAGGGSVFTTAALGTDWTEVWLDFSRDPGCGRFNPAQVTEIVLTVAHELTTPVEVTVDTIAAWKERVPSGAIRLGLNVPPLPGPGDWSPDFRTANCAGRSALAEGLVLSFWSAAVPYASWPIVASWRELPRGLDGAGVIVASVRLEPAQPAVLLKFTLVEQGGEQFSALRALPADGPTLRIPVSEFVWDAVANLRTPPPQPGNGLLDLASVTGWRLELVPTTERQCRGTLFVKELWAEGKGGAKPAAKAAAGAPGAVPATTAGSGTKAGSGGAPATSSPSAQPAPKPAAPKPAAAEAGEEGIEDGAAPEGAGAEPAAPEGAGAEAGEPAAPAEKAAPSGEAAEGGAESEAAPAAPKEPAAPAEEAAPAAPKEPASPAPESSPAPDEAPPEAPATEENL